MTNHQEMKFLARRYDSACPVRVTIRGEKIDSVEPLSESTEGLPFIAPGLFDLQINGGLGVEFSSDQLTEARTLDVFRMVLSLGVFRFCPTITTNSDEAILHASKTIADAVSRHPEMEPLFAGIHLEGPFISSADGPRGAHPKRYCRPYDLNLIDKIREVTGNRLAIVTLSPEYDGAEEFIKKLVERGILVSLGHTGATPVQIARAAAAGARLSTHLANGSDHLFPKAGNYFFAQVTDDRLSASLIGDGFHLSPMMMKTILRTKTAARTILISDQAQVAGLAPGRYLTGLCELELQENGKIVLASNPQLLAAASFPVSRGVCNLIASAGLSLKESFDLATVHPARLLGLSDFSNGTGDFLALGKTADFLVFRVTPSRPGPLGIADTDSFQTGHFDFESIIWRGERIPAL